MNQQLNLIDAMLKILDGVRLTETAAISDSLEWTNHVFDMLGGIRRLSTVGDVEDLCNLYERWYVV